MTCWIDPIRCSHLGVADRGTPDVQGLAKQILPSLAGGLLPDATQEALLSACGASALLFAGAGWHGSCLYQLNVLCCVICLPHSRGPLLAQLLLIPGEEGIECRRLHLMMKTPSSMHVLSSEFRAGD